MSQTEHARVQALLASGRITPDEAEILFAALGDGDESAQEEPAAPVDSPSNDTSSGLAELTPPRRPVTNETLKAEPNPVLPPRPPEPPRRLPEPDAATQPSQWLKLSGFCGDLSVEADPTLGTPVVTGKATLERTETGYLIRTPPEAKGEGNWLTRLHQAAGDVRVRLPAEMGLDLRIAAGDGEVRGVKRVKGNFTGGDFTASEAEHLDLTVTAGDVTLKLRPQTGQQRLRATSGDVDLTFLAGSSATVSGSATCGDLTLPDSFSRSGGFVGGNFEGTVGAGEARLELRLTAGDVTIKGDA